MSFKVVRDTTVYPEEVRDYSDPTENENKWYKKVIKKLKRQRWRLNNLYKIVDVEGKERTFKMRYAQKLLYLGMHYLNLVLKSRQHGITTFICLLFLDTCMFNSNTHACIIAHNKDDAKDFFVKKIMYAYNSLPDLIRNNITAKRASTSELMFSNGSSIRVTTSGRSGTYQLIHISEFGKICAKYPHKAQEIITGTLNAVHPGQLVFIESTAEGREGRFYDMSTEAQKLKQTASMLTQMQWKFFFFGWMDNPLNQMKTEEAKKVVITERLRKYFDNVETVLKRIIPIEFKAWYVNKERDQGDLMLQEHPSTPEEAFMQSVRGVYYATQMLKARKQGRILHLPPQPNYSVDTWWDIGFNDVNSIWFIQTVGMQIHVIDYYQDSGEGLGFYCEYLKARAKEMGYVYGTHWAPHDMDVHDYSIGRTRTSFASDYGIKFRVVPKLSIEAGIEAVRRILPYCVFDIERCDDGLKCLESYRKEWDEKKATYRNKPYHDQASNGADAFRIGATAHKFTKVNFNHVGMNLVPKSAPNPKGWT